MPRGSVYNAGLTDDYDKVNPKNIELVNDFINYSFAMDKQPTTMKVYINQLRIFFCWNYKYNNDKFFVELKNRDFVNYLGYVRCTLKASSKRITSLRAAISTFSNFIESQYEDEYPTFKNRIKNLEKTPNTAKLEKTIISEPQLKSMLDTLVSMKKYQLACWLALLASSGSRKSEMIQMKTTYFNEDHVIKTDMYEMYRTDTMRSKGRGTEGKQIKRYVIRETFDPYLQLWLKEREELCIDSEWLFVAKDKDGYHQAKICTADMYALNISTIFDMDFYNHCMRHYFCTKLKSLKWPDEIVVSILQWSSADMVKIYNDISDDEILLNFLNTK